MLPRRQRLHTRLTMVLSTILIFQRGWSWKTIQGLDPLCVMEWYEAVLIEGTFLTS